MSSLLSTDSAVEQLQWKVVGAGSIGRRHLRNLLALGASELAAVRRRAEPLADPLAAVPVVAALPDASGPAAVAIICTPTSQHRADTLAALARGYHVLVEKPLAETPEDAAVLVAAARSAGKRAMVACVLRFHPVIERVHAIVRAGLLGRVHSAAAWCGQFLPDWRPAIDYRTSYSARAEQGGGVLLDLVHEIDYLQHLFGPARSVLASVTAPRLAGIDSDDNVDLICEYADALIATCHLDYLARPAQRGGRVIAERGSLQWDLIQPAVRQWTVDQPVWEEWRPAGDWTVDLMYQQQLREFAAAVLTGAATRSEAENALNALQVVTGARRAAAEGRKVIL